MKGTDESFRRHDARRAQRCARYSVARFEIEVREGRVRIDGTVDRRSTARIIERLIGLLDGVSEVASSIGWEFDDSHIEPPGESESEPGAASITARRPPSRSIGKP